MRDCVPVDQKREKYRAKLEQLFDVLETGNLDHEGVQSRLLHALEPLPFDADINQHVLKFTGRKWVLDMIDGWLDDEKARRILWITGLPGSGKSAIAAYLCYYRPEVTAFHLCKHNTAQGSGVQRCIESIAYQLSTQIPEYRTNLNGLPLENIISSSDNAQLFERLIVEPLSSIKPKSSRPQLVVIDSIDQAGQVNNEIARLISTLFLKTPPWLRLFITSRPDPPILRLLKDIEPFVLDIASVENEQDLRAYVYGELCTKFSCPSPLIDVAVNAIIAKSEGNMLYVDLICREISQGRLSLDKLGDFPKGLGAAFVEFFIRQFNSVEEYKAKYRPLLELIVAAMAPLPIDVAVGALVMDELGIMELSDKMGSLFPVSNGHIRPFHKSLIDWLKYADRAGQYFVSQNKGHKRLADYGMQEYSAGVNSMSRYMLAYLPEHLAKADRLDDLKAVVSDRSYLERLIKTGIRKSDDLTRYNVMIEPFVKSDADDITRML
jgi:hypothetical protein